jgi:Ni,Fe-hydrogenase III large subunit
MTASFFDPTTISEILWTYNLAPVSIRDIPVYEEEAFRRAVIGCCKEGGRLVALFALNDAALLAVLSKDKLGKIGVVKATVEGKEFTSLTPDLPSAQAFEREIFENFGIRPKGHPWLKPLRRHADLDTTPHSEDAHPFFRVEGPGIHEVAVGPVHAGVIEPGHFRFQCAGETVLHLEIQLGYQHRGAEKALMAALPQRRVSVAESIAGDTTIGHGNAYTGLIEALGEVDAPLRAQTIIGIALELERLANHVGDLGALCNDVGYLPGASWFGRIRGEFLNSLLDLSGNRLGRGLLCPGGIRFDVDDSSRQAIRKRLKGAGRDISHVVEIVFRASTVVSRFEQTGKISRETAEDLGLVGPSARAAGCDLDVRRDHPFGVFRFAQIPVTANDSGDVMARAFMRSAETKRSLQFLQEQLENLPRGPVVREVPLARPDSFAVSLIEGWRGEICHAAMTDATGNLCFYKVVDPSFHNWMGLAMAMRGRPISDFPLCNKSFNLSYAGHDL